ncbi:MAG: hypothetical protein ACXWT0_10680 [Methylobacter sp.]
MVNQLAKIAETPYFSHELNAYLGQIRAVTENLISDFSAIPSEVSDGMMEQIWTASKFLSGSTSKKIPYEIAHCLKVALEDWTHKKALITTALTQDKAFSFYFQGVSQQFYILAEAYSGIRFESELVQIAFPKLYQHRPLLNVALYHELGHFLDTHQGIVNQTLLLVHSDQFPLPSVDFNGLSLDLINQVATNHRKEYFADLFAASYAGNAYRDFLAEFAPNNQVCVTHPATKDRLALIDTFLSESKSDIIDLFQLTLSHLGLQQLKMAFSVPDVFDSFTNARPYVIKNKAELHGIFEAGATYLKSLQSKPISPWIEAGEITTERAINDLVEKSIRNCMITDRWKKN